MKHPSTIPRQVATIGKDAMGHDKVKETCLWSKKVGLQPGQTKSLQASETTYNHYGIKSLNLRPSLCIKDPIFVARN